MELSDHEPFPEYNEDHLGLVQEALEAYRAENGQYPSTGDWYLSDNPLDGFIERPSLIDYYGEPLLYMGFVEDGSVVNYRLTTVSDDLSCPIDPDKHRFPDHGPISIIFPRDREGIIVRQPSSYEAPCAREGGGNMDRQFRVRVVVHAAMTTMGFIIVAGLISSCVTAQLAEDPVLLLSFDGEEYVFEGPEYIKAGPVTLVVVNESDESASAHLEKHDSSHTHQDMLDIFDEGQMEDTGTKPDWTTVIPGVWYDRGIRSGKHRIWRGELEAGLYTLTLVNFSKQKVWYAAGLTVVD